MHLRRGLKTLDVSHNALSYLPDGLWMLASLQQLLMGHNHVAGIKTDIGQLTSLQV